MNEKNDEYMSWIRSRPASFREAHSRGSQTTTTDLDESDYRQELRSITPATNVRRASLLLSDLRAIYSTQQTGEQAPSQNEIRSPPSSSNPWNIYYRENVLPDLDRICQLRKVWEQKCRSLIDKTGKKTMRRCFFCWRQSNLRALNRNLTSNVEKNSNNFYKQRRASVVKVWSHIAIRFNAQKEVLEKRRGGLELASETIGQRLVRKNEGAGSITSGMIDNEIDHILAYDAMDIWLSGYRRITYFKLWRENMSLPTQYFNKKRCRAVISCWRAQSKAAIDLAGRALTLDYSRYEEAKSFHRRKMIAVVLQRWKLRLQLLSNFASFCCRMYQSIQDVNTESKRHVLSRWSIAVKANRTYCKLPFQQWREVTFNEKHRTRIQYRLASVFLRSKSRRQAWTSFRLWKQQSQYSRVAALYNRRELALGLLQQKHRCEQLASEVDDMKAKLQSYHQLEMQVKRLEQKLRQSESARNNMKNELSKLKGSNGRFSSNPLCDSLETLCPLLMHSKNML